MISSFQSANTGILFLNYQVNSLNQSFKEQNALALKSLIANIRPCLVSGAIIISSKAQVGFDARKVGYCLIVISCQTNAPRVMEDTQFQLN